MIIVTQKPSDNIMQEVAAMFDYNYMEDDFDNQLYQKIVLDIDKTEISSTRLYSKVMECTISPTQLSKTSKLLYNILFELEDEDALIPMYFIGDNGLKWLFDISNYLNKDLTLYSDAYRKVKWMEGNVSKVQYLDIDGVLHNLSNELDFMKLWDIDDERLWRR